MNSEQLFLHRINALRRIISNRSPEELLELAGILRQLLMDSTPLVHVINREFREKLIFVVAPSAEERNKRQREKVPDLPLPGFSFSSIIPKDERIELSLDQFLAHSLLYLRNVDFETGYYYSVRDIISICANKLGGVHYDLPEKDEPHQSLIRGFNQFVNLYGSSFAFSTLAEIATVVDTSLESLYDKVNSKYDEV